MIKTKLFTAAAMAAVMAAAPALAQESSSDPQGQVDVYGSVAGRCLFTLDSDVIDLGELAVGGSGSNAGFLNDAAVEAGTAQLHGWCNGTPSTMTVETFALENQDFLTSPPSGFDRVVNYTATADNGPNDASDDSNTTGPGAPVTVGIFESDIDITLSLPSTPNSGRLVAGDYQGRIVVTLAPNAGLPQSE